MRGRRWGRRCDVKVVVRGEEGDKSSIGMVVMSDWVMVLFR